MIDSDVTDKGAVIKKQINDFSSLLAKLTEVDEKQRYLWNQIYSNALDDRTRALVMYETLVDACGGRSAELAVHGPQMVKYIERMSRANEQLIKLSELVDNALVKSEVMTTEGLYDQFDKKR